MGKMKKLLWLLLLAFAFCPLPFAFPQTPIQTDRLITNEVQVLTPALVPVSTVNAQVIGNGGSATYYYWIVARYAAGNATPSNYALVISAPSTLSASNRVRVTWAGVAGATGYDVLRTTTAQLPNGSALIGRSLNQATTSYDDTGGAMLAYTVSTLRPRQLVQQFVTPYMDFLGQVAPPVSPANHGRIYYDLAANQWMASRNGGAYTAFGGGAGAGILSLNGLSAPDQFLDVSCTAGLDVNIQPNIDTNVFCFPDASATARGLVTTGAQVFGGNKTFSGDTLLDGDAYVTGFFSTDHPIEMTIGDVCGNSEAGTALLCIDPTTFELKASIDAGDPAIVYTSANPPPSPTPVSTGNYLINYGVAWVSGLTYHVSAATYVIGGVRYSSPEGDITLDASDPANDRIDVIAVDDTGSVVKITGTPAGPPTKPDVDPATQLELTYAYIAAAAVVPSNISTDNIYLENAGPPAEWTCSGSSGAYNCNSTNNPYAGAKDVEVTAAAKLSYAQFVRSAGAAISTWNNLVFHIRSKAPWSSSRSLNIQFMNGTANVGSAVSLNDGTFNFSSGNTASYQQIVVPLSLFGADGSTVDRVRFIVTGTGSATIGFYLDNIQLQGGVPPSTLPSNIMIWRGTWNSTATYNPNDVVTSGGATYVALVSNTNVTPVAGATWAVFGASTTQPFDTPTFFPGVPTASQVMQRIVYARPVTIPAGLTATVCSAGTAATAQTDIDLQKNGVSFGTLTFAAAGTTCSLTSAAGASFNGTTDVLTILNANPADVTLADIAITLAGTR